VIPTKVVTDKQVRPDPSSLLDAWTAQVNLDPTKDWSGSTFTVESSAPDPYGVVLDVTHKASSPPYILLTLPPSSIFQGGPIVDSTVRWNLGEDTVLRRTFLTGLVRLVDR
jgi:hypothetical protein